MKINQKEFGSRIKQIRGDKSLEVFSQIIGISKNMISLYERGEAWPKPEILSRIAEYGKVSFEWLLTGEKTVEEPAPAPETDPTIIEFDNIKERIKQTVESKRWLIIGKIKEELEKN